MPQTTKIHQLGFRQARALCNMDAKRRLQFIAEGLPIIAESARSLMDASRRLADFPREAELLEGHAVEESAKALILIDIVRCPSKLISSRCGPMMDWFYDHQARLLFAEAQHWVAYSSTMLQGYLDSNRETFYLEGGLGEYIMPNWEIFKREATLYADAIGNMDDEPSWHSPQSTAQHRSIGEDSLQTTPSAYRVLESLDAFGAFSAKGVRIVHEVWSKIDFSADDAAWSDARSLTQEMLTKLQSAGLFSDRAEERHVGALYRHWQKPLYFADLSPLPVTLEEMKRRQDAAFASEFDF